MNCHFPSFCSRQRLSVLALVTFGLAGCSSDVTRFSITNPFASNSAAPSTEVTGSVPAKGAAPAGKIESQPLPQPQTAQTPPVVSAPATVASRPGMAGGGGGLGSYHPAPAGSDITGSIAAHQAKPQARWVVDGGTIVMAKPGDTLGGLSQRFGVPVAALAQVNGIGASSALQPGQRIIIPRNAQASQTAAVSRPVAPAGAAAPAAQAGTHVVQPGETLNKLSRQYHVSVVEIAKANKIEPHAQLKMGERVVIPGRIASAPQTRPASAPQISQPSSVPAAPQKVVAAEPQQTARVVTPAAETPSPKNAARSAEPAGSLATFRWPARGRIIAGFGPKPNGQQNDGINIAVPEGTPVRASEDGVVAYAGNELKGYGNLVLVRHADGFVTAYAHASELMVKRNDQVKRGQIIARAGQTGNVTSPQLHFEIRKGATPVDPLQYLNGS
jgi:murein DD-endopeptidase MepM/ murein hydrolase activator NlpD